MLKFLPPVPGRQHDEPRDHDRRDHGRHHEDHCKRRKPKHCKHHHKPKKKHCHR
jgi:hypothetical protein